MISRDLKKLFTHCFYSYSSINQKFIALAFMVHPNDTYNTCENHNTPYNAFHENEQIRFVEIQNGNLQLFVEMMAVAVDFHLIRKF